VLPQDDDLKRLARSLHYGAYPLDGVITAGQLRAEDLPQIAEAGCRVVMDIRAPDEPRDYDEPRAVQAAGLEYRNVPVAYDGIPDETFDLVRTTLRNDRPLVLHCNSANRVGAMLLPYLVLDEHHDPDDAFDLACAVGMRNAALAEFAMEYIERHR